MQHLNMIHENVQTGVDIIIEMIEKIIFVYNEVSKDVDILAKKLEDLKKVVEKIKIYELIPSNARLLKIYGKVIRLETVIIKSLYRKDKIRMSKNLVKKSAYKVKKFLIYASEVSANFKFLNDALDELFEELIMTIKLVEVLSQPSTWTYNIGFINDECRKFWMHIVRTSDIYERDLWNCFYEKYKMDYLDNEYSKIEKRNWSSTDWNSVRLFSSGYENDLTLVGFINLTNIAGFPIDIDKVPDILKSDHIIDNTMSEVVRLEVGKMVNELFARYNSEEMIHHMDSVENWYKHCTYELENLDLPKKEENETIEETKLRILKENKIIKQYKADKCIRILRRIHYDIIPREELSLEEIMAQDVLKSRMKVDDFYRQFLAVWEYGNLSRDICKTLNFPGKANIKLYINNFEPLSFAHFRINLCRPSHGWDARKPNIYKLLKDILINGEYFF